MWGFSWHVSNQVKVSVLMFFEAVGYRIAGVIDISNDGTVPSHDYRIG